MKKMLSFMLVVSIIMGITSCSMAKDFEGVINYKISFSGMEVDPSMSAMMPKVAKMTVSGDMSKFEISMGQMGSQIQIMDGQAKTITNCVSMMGQKFYYVETEEDLMEDMESNEDVKVEIKDETKEIAGYECSKAVVTVNTSGEEMIFTVYFTDEIQSSSFNMDNPYFKDVPGALMEFELEAGQGMMMKMEATSVDKKKISDSEFEVPEGYVKKTREEMNQMYGGGM